MRDHIFYMDKDNALFEQPDYGVAKIDTVTGCFNMVNHRFCDIFGFTPEELIGKSYEILMYPEDIEQDRINRDKLRKGKIPTLKQEKQCIKKDGTSIWIHLMLLPLWQMGDTPDFYVCVVENIAGREISEKRHTETFFRANEKRFFRALDNMPILVSIYDAEGRIVYINELTRKLTGLKLKDIIGKRENELFPKEVYERYFPALYETLRSGIPHSLEIDLSIPGAKIINILCSFIPFLDEEGKVQEVMAVAQDLTGHRKLEYNLKLTKFAIDHASFGCHWISSDGIFVYVNHHFCRSLGYSQEELLNMSVIDIDPNQTPHEWEKTWEDIKTRKNITVRTEHRRKDGSKFPVEVTVNYMKFDETEYSSVYVRDLTDIMNTLESLRENETRLRQAVKVAGVGIFDYLFDEDVAYWSPEMYEIYDRHPDKPITIAGFLDIIHPDDRKQVIKSYQDTFSPHSDGDLFNEYKILLPDGTVRNISAQSQIIYKGEGEKRRPVRLIGAARDITYQKKAEEEHEQLQVQLFQSQKIDAIGQLAGGVAHDFNNMLQAILGYTEMGIMYTEKGSRVNNFFVEIRKAANRSTDLTRQLLTFARKQTINPRVMDINGAISVMVKIIQRLIGENIELVWNPCFNVWPVKMDPTQVDQILINISANARDAISGAGIITIETENVVINEIYCTANAGFLPGDYVMIAFSDNGCGMEEEVLNHIFEPFYTTKALGQGTGLGLPTVHGIVKQNNGFINIYSEPGKGTTFRIYLPRVDADVETDLHPVNGDSVHGNETILIVEDDPAILRIGAAILESSGYKILTAQTPGVAIDMLTNNSYKIDLLITDVVMPEMNGKELNEKIKNMIPGIKTLFMSGYPANIIAHHGMLETDINFIHKPFSIHALTNKVRQVLDGE